MQAIMKATGNVRRLLMTISAILIAVSSAFATINAIARFTFSGFSWAEEICTYCIVLMVYLALPQLEGTGDQLCISAIDLLVKGETAQRILNYIRGIITSITMAVLCYNGLQVMLKAFKRSQVTFVLQLPKCALYGIATACIAITLIIWLALMVCNKGESDK